MNFLVIRFRQMGDTVLSTPLLSTLRASFPGSRIDIVLCERLAPLLENHPSVDHVLTFSERERHHILTYLRKVWRITHAVRYDAIFDMRSNMNTLVFSLFSRGTAIRSGIDKGYSRFFLTDAAAPCGKDTYVADYDLRLLAPLQRVRPLTLCHQLSLQLREEERRQFEGYMRQRGIDFGRPVLLAGVTAKLAHKAWGKEHMETVLRQILQAFPDMQIILNYAPGREKEEAQSIAARLDSPLVFWGIEAKGIRQLMAMSACCTCYFGNEGGTRHIVDAMGKPTFSVCSPAVSRGKWIPADSVRHQSVAPADFASAEQLATLSPAELYALVTPERVWRRLQPFLRRHCGG